MAALRLPLQIIFTQVPSRSMSKSPSPIERLPDARVRCTVTFEPERVRASEEKALEHLAASVKLPGFRPGKAPGDMLREKIDPNELLEETIRQLLPETFSSLLKEHDIKPIIHPKVELQKKDPLTLTVTFVEKPTVKVKGLEKIKVEKKEPKVDGKDVERMENYFLEQHRTYTPVERASKEGDRIKVDFHGTDEQGKEIEGTRSQSYGIVLGSKTLIPGFEDALLGLKKDEKKSFALKFPEKYHAEKLAGTPVTFHASVVGVEEVNSPKMDDAFAKKNFNVESVAELRKQIEDRMRAEENNIERSRREQALLEQIREHTVVELAPELVDEEEHAVMEQFERQLREQNMSAADWFAQSKKDPVELRNEMKEQAKKRITLRLGLEKVVEEKGQRLTEDDMKKVIEEFVRSLPPEKRKEIDTQLQKGSDLYERLRWQKEVEQTIEILLAA